MTTTDEERFRAEDAEDQRQRWRKVAVIGVGKQLEQPFLSYEDVVLGVQEVADALATPLTNTEADWKAIFDKAIKGSLTESVEEEIVETTVLPFIRRMARSTPFVVFKGHFRDGNLVANGATTQTVHAIARAVWSLCGNSAWKSSNLLSRKAFKFAPGRDDKIDWDSLDSGKLPLISEKDQISLVEERFSSMPSAARLAEIQNIRTKEEFDREVEIVVKGSADTHCCKGPINAVVAIALEAAIETYKELCSKGIERAIAEEYAMDTYYKYAVAVKQAEYPAPTDASRPVTFRGLFEAESLRFMIPQPDTFRRLIKNDVLEVGVVDENRGPEKAIFREERRTPLLETLYWEIWAIVLQFESTVVVNGKLQETALKDQVAKAINKKLWINCDKILPLLIKREETNNEATVLANMHNAVVPRQPAFNSHRPFGHEASLASMGRNGQPQVDTGYANIVATELSDHSNRDRQLGNREFMPERFGNIAMNALEGIENHYVGFRMYLDHRDERDRLERESIRQELERKDIRDREEREHKDEMFRQERDLRDQRDRQERERNDERDRQERDLRDQRDREERDLRDQRDRQERESFMKVFERVIIQERGRMDDEDEETHLDRKLDALQKTLIHEIRSSTNEIVTGINSALTGHLRRDTLESPASTFTRPAEHGDVARETP